MTTETAPNNERIIDKVRKLLALAQSPNQAEAESAMAKATALMTEHNLTMARVNVGKKSNYERNEGIDLGKRIMTEQSIILHICKVFFFVEVVVDRTVSPNAYAVLIGTAENIETATYVYNFLVTTFRRLWGAHRCRFGAYKGDRASYMTGLGEGLRVKLYEEQQRVVESMALVLVRDPELMEASKKFFPDTTTTYIKRPMTAAYGHGVQAGKAIQINPGIGGAAAQQIGGR